MQDRGTTKSWAADNYAKGKQGTIHVVFAAMKYEDAGRLK